MLRLPEARFDVVRPGIALFGVSPFDVDGALPAADTALARELKPVMRVRTEIVALREVAPGERIGYGHTWKAERRSLIATVPHGLRRRAEPAALEPRPRARPRPARAHRRRGVDGPDDARRDRRPRRAPRRRGRLPRRAGGARSVATRSARPRSRRTRGASRGRCSRASRAACRASTASPDGGRRSGLSQRW